MVRLWTVNSSISKSSEPGLLLPCHFIHIKSVLMVYNISIFPFCTDLIVDWASATVSVGRMRGISDPLMSADENTPDFPVVTYSYFITYVFFSHQTCANQVTHLCLWHTVLFIL